MEKSGPIIAMIGTSLETMGGVSTVVGVYRRTGLFDRWPITYFSSHTDGGNVVKLGCAAKALSRYLMALLSGKIAIVHAHLASRASFWRKSLFLLPAFVFRRPVIIHLHGAEFMQFYHDECGALKRWFIRFVFNRAARVIVLSTQWKQMIAEITSNPAVMSIFNPIEVPAYQAEQEISRDSTTLLFLGRMGDRKGIYDLLEVVALLRKDFPAIHLLCGGDGDLEGVARQSQKLGIQDCVEVLGWVSGEDKEDLLLRATVYVLPSYAEGLPMSVLEAMGVGLPVISTSVGGIPDAIEDGVTGLLVSPGDHAQLASAISRLLKDEQLRDKLGCASMEKVRSQFGTDVILPQLEAVYRDLGMSPIDGT